MSGIAIRKAVAGDVGEVMRVFEAARRFMRRSGNMHQWVGGYPSEETVLGDIAAGHLYVGEADCGGIVMAFAFIPGNDPTYSLIEDGTWLDDSPYGTIHRLGSDGRRGGVLAACVDFCASLTDNIRLDTHADNAAMRAGAERLGFRRCGVIYCQDGTPRIAYQRITRD